MRTMIKRTVYVLELKKTYRPRPRKRYVKCGPCLGTGIGQFRPVCKICDGTGKLECS